MSIYKKLTAQDVAVIPFNAHKQYDFTSGSASSNSINHFDTRWTSESIDMYSSSSTEYGLPGDSINTIKYYRENPGSFDVFIGTDLIGDYFKDIETLLDK